MALATFLISVLLFSLLLLVVNLEEYLLFDAKIYEHDRLSYVPVNLMLFTCRIYLSKFCLFWHNKSICMSSVLLYIYV